MSMASAGAIQANERGTELAHERRYAESIPHYERALALAPAWFAPHINLGAACKHTSDFERSLTECLKALELGPKHVRGQALWNVGIAATALGDWPRARWAWAESGVRLPPGEGPITMNIGATPIRVSCHEHPEIVWCDRVDPARARIENVPTPETGRRYHDLVLHDGEPRGQRRYKGQMLPVFDELAVLERSDFRTFRVDVVAPTERALSALLRTVSERTDAALEDWTGSLELLCRGCSEGVPHDHVDREQPWTPERMLGVATRDEAVFDVIRAWARSKKRSASSPKLLLA